MRFFFAGRIDPKWKRHRESISGETMNAIGLMSGTSADGIDAALVEVARESDDLRWTLRAFECVPFPDEVRRGILSLCDANTGRVDAICRMNALLGEYFADAALAVCQKGGMRPEQVDAIGSHGQTIHHVPEPFAMGGKTVRATLQIGDPAVIAERTGITTVADFRARDMAAGGQGAPLVPLVDFLLFRSTGAGRVMLNIGGIANVTALPAGCAASDVFAFDTGPGNMVIDGLMQVLTQGAQGYDAGGRFAAQGRVLDALLDDLMGHPYFAALPPKSTGREVFGREMVARLLDSGEVAHDLVRTATAWTARSIADAIARFVLPVCEISEVVASGGGVENPVLMGDLQQALGSIRLRRVEELGLPSEAKEAVAFAVLAFETLSMRPGNVPRVTGAAHPVVLGSVTPGQRCRFPVDAMG